MASGARKSGGGVGNKNKKNQERAAYMKRMGIERTTGRCPVCYRIVKNGTHPHPALCSKE